MSNQTEFVLRNDGNWYAPPIDPNEILDFTLDFTRYLGIDTIDFIIGVVATDITIHLVENDAHTVTVWLKQGLLKKVATVTTTLMTSGGRRVERTFRIEVLQQ